MKKLILMAIVAAAAWSGWHARRSAPPEVTGARLVFNRLWIDHLPTGERDPVNLFLVSRPESLGVFAEGSMWRGQMERFRFETEGDELRIVYPWSGDRERVTVNAAACHVDHMDFCLELTGSSHGVTRYFSRHGWERQSMDGLRTLADQLQAGPRAP